MKTSTEIRDEILKKEAKVLAGTFLSRGMSMRDLKDYSEIIKNEADYQVKNNTIGGLSNGRIV